jgi:hypothetical protein
MVQNTLKKTSQKQNEFPPNFIRKFICKCCILSTKLLYKAATTYSQFFNILVDGLLRAKLRRYPQRQATERYTSTTANRDGCRESRLNEKNISPNRKYKTQKRVLENARQPISPRIQRSTLNRSYQLSENERQIVSPMTWRAVARNCI